MPWVRSHWRGDGSRKRDGDDFRLRQKLNIVARLIEKGLTKDQVSLEYQNIWEEAQAWKERGELTAWEASLPPGGRWTTENMYEVNGMMFFRPAGE